MALTVMPGAARALVLDLEALGVDPAPYLQKAGLSRAAVFDPDGRLPMGSTEALWQAAAEHVGDPLRAAERLPLGAYRVLDFICANSETIGGGLQRIAAYFPLVDPRVRLVVDPHVRDGDAGDVCTFSMSLIDRAPVPALAQLFTLGAVVSRSRRFSGVHWPLVRVDLTCDPALLAGRALETFFGCPIALTAKDARLVFSKQTYALPVPHAERELLSLLDLHAKQQLATLQPIDDPLPGFKEAVRTACAEGRPTLAIVARRLGVTTRTLQRRLEENGTSFSALVDVERERLARAYLSERGLAIAEIAFVLGFSDQPAFTRAFSRWTGQTPHAYRRTAAPAAPA